MLAILTFNWIGYRWLMNWMEKRADYQLEARLDNNDYDESSLIEITVPLDLPYQIDSRDFERCNGEVTVAGVHYKYVKRKVQDGNLVLKCIPNETKQQLRTAKDHFYQLVNDLQQDNSAKKQTPVKPVNVVKSAIGDFELQTDLFALQHLSILPATYSSSYEDFIPTRPHSSVEQPPDALFPII